jgi:hypothetical protein
MGMTEAGFGFDVELCWAQTNSEHRNARRQESIRQGRTLGRDGAVEPVICAHPRGVIVSEPGRHFGGIGVWPHACGPDPVAWICVMLERRLAGNERTWARIETGRSVGCGSESSRNVGMCTVNETIDAALYSLISSAQAPNSTTMPEDSASTATKPPTGQPSYP